MKMIDISRLKITLLLALCLVSNYQEVKSQSSVAANTSGTTKIFSGSTLKEEDGLSKAHAEFVGTVTQVGIPSPAGPNQASYRIKCTGLQILKGSVDTQTPIILFTDGVNHEDPPDVGCKYIFFIREQPGRNIVLKVTLATDANIAKVKALIAAGSASK